MNAGSPSNPPAPRAGEAMIQWLVAFVLANIASTAVIVATGHGGSTTAATPTWVFALAAMAMWGVYLIAVYRYAMSRGATSMGSDVRLSFARADAWGVALGAGSQLVLVNLVNWPLSRLFPGVFDFDKVSARARDLTDASAGAWVVVLVLLVVVGAPLVEEIVYRGMVQPGLVSRWGAGIGVWATAILFAAIHLVPVEFPGLLSFALVLGWARQRTGRLGLPIVTHMAFNATGLALALLR